MTQTATPPSPPAGADPQTPVSSSQEIRCKKSLAFFYHFRAPQNDEEMGRPLLGRQRAAVQRRYEEKRVLCVRQDAQGRISIGCIKDLDRDFLKVFGASLLGTLIILFFVLIG